MVESPSLRCQKYINSFHLEVLSKSGKSSFTVHSWVLYISAKCWLIERGLLPKTYAWCPKHQTAKWCCWFDGHCLKEKNYFAPFVKRKAFFSFTHASSPFPVMDIWEFSANLIVFFFLFIHFFFFRFQFSIYLFIQIFIPYKFLENGSNIFHHYSRSAFLGEKRLIKNIFLIIVMFLDNKYIKTLLNSNKILSEILNQLVL